MDRNRSTLLDIVRAAELAIKFSAGMDKTSFLKDEKTQSAVLHQLMIMGEAVKRLSDDFRNTHSKIPWALVAGMRDKLIHGYDIVDLSQVWKTLIDDVPAFLAEIQSLLSK